MAAPVNDPAPTAEKRDPARLDKVVTLCKRRGFVFPSGEIYGGTRSAWDYGPLGTELKENIKRQWWRTVVTARDDVVGLDSSVILPRQVWVASGHVGVFTDPLTECQSCHKRFRADHLEEEFEARKGRAPENGLADISCPNCGTKGAWTEPRDFNMMLKTYLGPVEDESGLHYLRPETAQGIFVNFANVMGAARKKPPFGIGQIGKSFRNEITPGNFIFRTREFEQMEMEFFVEPGTDEEWHQYWIDQRTSWYTDLGIDRDNLRHFEHPKEKLSHYSKRTVDIEYRFGFAGGGLDHVRDVLLARLRVAEAEVLARGLRVRAEVEVAAVGDALELRPAVGEEVLHVAGLARVVRELVRVVRAQAQALRVDPQPHVPVEALLHPVLVPVLGLVGRNEELHLHLLELERAEDEVPRGDLVAERLADLGDAERRLAAGVAERRLEVEEDALRRLRA